MIDFRYHLISLIGVILALALGILAGSGFLGGPILEQLQDDVDNFRTEARELQEVITAQDVAIDQAEQFAAAAAPIMLRQRLTGREIVLFQFEGTDGRLVDGIRDAATQAGATVASQITFTAKLELGSAPIREELSLITRSLTGEPDALLGEAAELIGQRAAAAAAESTGGDTSAAERFRSLIDELEAAAFAGADIPAEGRSVPAGALFVVVGGSGDRPPFDAATFSIALARGLTEMGAPTIFVEGANSVWDIVPSLRNDIETRTRVSTVDNGETTIGRIAMVLALAEAGEDSAGHFGVKAGRTALIPDPDPNV